MKAYFTNLIKLSPDKMIESDMTQSSTINDIREQGIEENNNLSPAATNEGYFVIHIQVL